MAQPQRLPKITPDSIRMPAWLRWSVYGVTIVFTMTGILWIFAHFFLREAGEIEHPLEPWMLRIHGSAVMIGLFMYGSLLRPHITKAWNAKMNRWTGVVVCVVLAALTLSGYLLYYAGSEETRPIISAIHWSIGLLLPIWVPLHVIKGRARAKPANKTASIVPIKTLRPAQPASATEQHPVRQPAKAQVQAQAVKAKEEEYA